MDVASSRKRRDGRTRQGGTTGGWESCCKAGRTEDGRSVKCGIEGGKDISNDH